MKALALFLLLSHLGLLAVPVWSRGDPQRQRRHLAFQKPSRAHILGTDGYGRDLFWRIVFAVRWSLLTAAAGAAACLLVALLLGGVSGVLGGWTDELITRGGELVQSIPWLYLLLGLRAALPLDANPYTLLAAFAVLLAATGWAQPARILRGAVRSMRNVEFVLAARAMGASSVYILRRHLLPVLGPVLLIQATLLLPRFVLAEVTMGFFGFGVPEPEASLGGLLADGNRLESMLLYPWLLAPAAVLCALCAAYAGLGALIRREFEAWGLGG